MIPDYRRRGGGAIRYQGPGCAYACVHVYSRTNRGMGGWHGRGILAETLLQPAPPAIMVPPAEPYTRQYQDLC